MNDSIVENHQLAYVILRRVCRWVESEEIPRLIVNHGAQDSNERLTSGQKALPASLCRLERPQNI